MNAAESRDDIDACLVNYLRSHPNQRELSVGGLCVALQLTEKQVPELLQAALTLSSPQDAMLEVRYRLYDPSMEHAQEEMSQSEYENSIVEGCFVDVDGHEVNGTEFVRRARPYFIHRITTNECLHCPGSGPDVHL